MKRTGREGRQAGRQGRFITIYPHEVDEMKSHGVRVSVTVKEGNFRQQIKSHTK